MFHLALVLACALALAAAALTLTVVVAVTAASKVTVRNVSMMDSYTVLVGNIPWLYRRRLLDDMCCDELRQLGNSAVFTNDFRFKRDLGDTSVANGLLPPS
ncbi:unnamed protein product [Peniophora sp. CBMAI 1063]|nr:unnamed protein product [Peniophora sp. CBMAI 1063]